MKNIDFEKVILDKTELKTLKNLSKHKNVMIDTDVASSLLRINFVTQCITGYNRGFPVTDGRCNINDTGRRYLLYLKKIKSRHRTEWIRYIITTVIALVALTLSIISVYMQLSGQ